MGTKGEQKVKRQIIPIRGRGLSGGDLTAIVVDGRSDLDKFFCSGAGGYPRARIHRGRDHRTLGVARRSDNARRVVTGLRAWPPI